MTERYTTINQNRTVRYSAGCPVIIVASALLKDNQTSGVLAQLKLKNMSDKILVGCKVSLCAFELSGNKVEGVPSFSFLDISINSGAEFGQKTPIYLPNRATRIFSATVTEAIFSDGEVWKEKGGEWKTFPESALLNSVAGNDIIEEFYLESGIAKPVYVPKIQDDIALCSCGELFSLSKSICPKCSKRITDIIEIWNVEKLKEKSIERKKLADYNTACTLIKSDKLNEVKQALNIFDSLSGWRDADEKAKDCKKRIAELEEVEKQEKEAAKKRKKKAKIIVSAISLFMVAAAAFAYFLITIIIPNSKYNSAMELFSEGNYNEAAVIFEELGDYKNSSQMAAEARDIIKFIAKVDSIKSASVGYYVCFGEYNINTEQKTDIEWLVLEKEDDKALLISRYALDCQQYNTSDTSVTWETCSLREWLNGTFIDNAFSAAEQNLLLRTTVTADENPSYSTSPGNNTEDKVFLLSITEAYKYFSSDGARKCQGTDYCKTQGAYRAKGGTCNWWLRSLGNNSNNAACVSSGGSPSHVGHNISSYIAVRPAFWINLEPLD